MAGLVGGRHLAEFLPSQLEGMEGYLHQYESHVFNTFETTATFYEEILGVSVAQLQVADGGDLGVFRIGAICGWLSVIVLEIFLFLMSLRFIRACWYQRKFWLLLSFVLIASVVIFFFSTNSTQNEISSQLLNINATDYIPLPELTEEDPLPLSSLSAIFLSLFNAIDATWEAGKLWAIAVLLVLSPIIRLTVTMLIVTLPILKDVVQGLVELFLEQDPMNIYLEIGTVILFILLWLLKRHLDKARFFFFFFLFLFFFFSFFSLFFHVFIFSFFHFFISSYAPQNDLLFFKNKMKQNETK